MDNTENASPEEVEPNRILGKVAFGTDYLDVLSFLPLSVFRYGSTNSLDLADFESGTEAGWSVMKARQLERDVVNETNDASAAASHSDQIVSESTRVSPL